MALPRVHGWWRDDRMFQRPVSHSTRSLRLVVETDDPTLAISDFACFRDAGFDVAVCHGPDADDGCPATSGGRCDLVEDADVVMNALRDPDDQCIVVAAVRQADPHVPIVVCPAGASDENLPEDCTVVSPFTSINGQVDVVRRAAVSPEPITR